ncbi:MAG TPA: cation:proton antiporter [Candidatus Elarobacter sp.]|nr:cation:proton antiporter [Candidatus Elarobacter sp.]
MSAGAFTISLIVVAAVLAACAIGAPLFARIRQPRVVAELCVGILAGFGLAQGAAALGIAVPMPQVKAVLYWISEPALLAYMFCLGHATNVAHVRDGLARSSSIAVSRIVVAFTLTYCLLSLNLVWGLDQASSLGGKLAICGAMAVTAFPVMARILDELKMLSSRVGLTALSAAAVDDLFAWTLLAVLGAIATGAGASPNVWLERALFSLPCVATIVLIRSLTKRERRLPIVALASVGTLLLLVVIAMLLGIDPIIVAFAGGLLAPRIPAVSEPLRHVQRWATRLMPLFFALAGINAIIVGWLTALPAIALWTAWATVTTAGASYISARANQFDRQSSLMIASLMNCRGVVGLIFLSIGLRNGLITQHTYAVLLGVALATTLMTTPIVIFTARLRRGSIASAGGQPVGALLAEV